MKELLHIPKEVILGRQLPDEHSRSESSISDDEQDILITRNINNNFLRSGPLVESSIANLQDVETSGSTTNSDEPPKYTRHVRQCFDIKGAGGDSGCPGLARSNLQEEHKSLRLQREDSLNRLSMHRKAIPRRRSFPWINPSPTQSLNSSISGYVQGPVAFNSKVLMNDDNGYPAEIGESSSHQGETNQNIDREVVLDCSGLNRSECTALNSGFSHKGELQETTYCCALHYHQMSVQRYILGARNSKKVPGYRLASSEPNLHCIHHNIYCESVNKVSLQRKGQVLVDIHRTQ